MAKTRIPKQQCPACKDWCAHGFCGNCERVLTDVLHVGSVLSDLRTEGGALMPSIHAQENRMNKTVMFSKASDEWQTPIDTFNALHAEFGFDMDAAATCDNSWVDGDYFGPDHKNPAQRDALAVRTWRVYGQVFWLNPPYSQCRAFLTKAAMEAATGCTVVCLVPARTDTRWFHECVYDCDTETWRPGVLARFIKGRLKFHLPTNTCIRTSLRSSGTSNNCAPFPSMVIIFTPQ